jgi:uncharacterized membrane protein HdeD (DUF308 family)
METGSKSLIGQAASTIWWLVLLRGIFAIILGIILFTTPGATLIVIMTFLGAYWFVDGIFTLIASIQGKKENKNWGLGVFGAILSILAGLAVFAQPIVATIFTTAVLVYLMGFMILASGISSIATGFKLRKTSGEWVMIYGGVLAVLLGLLLLFNPILTASVFVSLLGFFSIVGGIILIVYSLKIRKLKKV